MLKKVIKYLIATVIVSMLSVQVFASEAESVVLRDVRRVDLSETEYVELFESTPWEADDHCYKDRLSERAAMIYEGMEDYFSSNFDEDDDGDDAKITVRVNGVDVDCWGSDSLATFTMTTTPDTDEWNEAFYFDLYQALFAFTYDHPEYFWIRTAIVGGYGWTQWGNTWTITIMAGFECQPVIDTVNEIEQYRDRIDDQVDDILEHVEDDSDLEKLQYFDEWLAANNHYNSKASAVDVAVYASELPWSMVSGLLDDDSPVCEGYSKSFQYLCHQIDIPCVTVSGFSNGGAHMWNAVLLNGTWYFVDTTWDDPIYSNGLTKDTSTKEYFLVPMPKSHFEAMYYLSGPQVSRQAFSGTITPIKKKLETPANLNWSDKQMQWEKNREDEKYIAGYTVELYHAVDSEDFDEAAELVKTFEVSADESAWPEIDMNFIIETGGGIYGFRVKTRSSDLVRREDSDFTEFALAYFRMPDQLPAPETLRWNDQGEFDVAIPGMISWCGGPYAYQLNVYRKTGSDAELVCEETIEPVEGQLNVHSTVFLEKEYLQPGSYYFTVKALGDQEICRDSEVSQSDLLKYNGSRENSKLDEPIWEGLQIRWHGLNDPKDFYIYQYEIIQQFRDQSEKTVHVDYFKGLQMNSEDILKWLCDSGTYAVRVRALFWNAAEVSFGEWSDYSDAYQLSEGTIHANEEIHRLIEQSLDVGMTPAQIRMMLLDALSAKEILDAMRADTCGHCIVDSFDMLDQSTGCEVDIISEVDALCDDGIQIIGATLNASAGSDVVTLTLDKSDVDHEEEAYSHVLPFSMKLEGVDRTAENKLQIPVQITLPVPEEVNPLYLVVLHYPEGSNTPEEIIPHVFEDEESGKWFATFAVDSFSDFALAEHITAVKSSGGVTINIQQTEHQYSNLICAVYDPDGKFLTIETMGLQHQIIEHEISCKNPGFVSFMVTDHKYAPLFPMEKIPVK